MTLACTMASGRGDTDLLLDRLAADMAARGLRCCGTVRINTARADALACDMDVRVLPRHWPTFAPPRGRFCLRL